MDDPKWKTVDTYLSSLVAPTDEALSAVLQANAQAGLPAIDVSPLFGKLLHLLARAIGAQRILEIGTLGGYSTIWLARAVPAGGRVVTLELNPAHADVARTNIERAGLSHLIEIRVGKAADSLAQMVAEGQGSFDLVFIDADKENNAEYVQWSLRLSRPGTVIVVDNVIRGGEVVNAANADPRVQGARKLFELLACEPRLSATGVQTVGVKGYDGFAIAVVR